MTDDELVEVDERATVTTPRGYRHPDGNESPDVPRWLGYLAADVDADVGTVDGKVTTNTTDITGLKNATTDTGPLADGAVPDPIASWASGWSQYSGGVWTPGGIRVRRWGPLVIITGAVQKSSAWVANETILTLAAGFRPDTRVANRTFTLETTGEVKVDTAGSAAIPIYAVFFRA